MFASRYARLWTLCALAALTACTGAPRGLPDSALPGAALVHPKNAGLSVPFFESSFSYAGQSFSYRMVGTDPTGRPATTRIPTEIVPIALTFSDGTVLDASSIAATVSSSPLFADATYAAGTTQFGDAVMRSEFWKQVARKPYHVLLDTPTVAPAFALSAPANDGYTQADKNGTRSGFITFSWFVQTMEPQIVAQLGIPPTTFVIFVTYDTKVLEPGNYCCYRGYHYAFSSPSVPGATWTTAWASVAPNSMAALSHEVAEWLNDPFYNNAVPSWIAPQTGACGGSLLEVGDPVTTHLFKAGGWIVQDIAFFSWFARQSPSLGIGKRYDLRGKLTHPAANCT